jgi:hypothetical protein
MPIPTVIRLPSALSTFPHNRSQPMKCPKCSSTVTPYSRVVNNGTQIITTWLCAHCLYRVSETADNPRYVRLVSEPAPRSRKPLPLASP